MKQVCCILLLVNIGILVSNFWYKSYDTLLILVPPITPPFTGADVMITTTSTTISLTFPFITTTFLNSDPINYLVRFQGYLYLNNLFLSSRRRRQSNHVVVYTTEVTEKTVPYTEDRTINLLDLLPNYRYDVNVSIETAYGQTSSVLIVPPVLDAIGNMIYVYSAFPKIYIYNKLFI